MVATYPDQATAPVTQFSTITQIVYTNTATTTDFNLAATVDNRGEVVAYADGVLQSTDSYDISNNGITVSFVTAPAATSLTLKTVNIPSRYRLTREYPAVRAVEYANAALTTVNGNTYSINSYTDSFALPEGVNVASSTDFMVFLSGVYQDPSSYTYPSVSLNYDGIDIGDNTATKLLLNYSGNFTDESSLPSTITNVGSVSTSNSAGRYEAVFSGSNYLSAPSNDKFNFHSQQVTLDTYFRPATGATMAANQTLFSRYEDSDNYYILRLVGANSNVGVVINSGGAITELYGGNANGGINYHVAVSYDINSTDINLYVNNVRTAQGSYSSSATTNGPIEIGRANTISQYFTGNIDFTRFASAYRYDSATSEPLVISPTPQTVISGAPLGAVSATDTLSIRVFDSSVTSVDRFSSMADRKPDKGISSKRSFDVATFTSQAGYEKRRLKSRRSKREYDLSYTNVTGIEKTAIENFYTARSGEYETFIFDLAHINESGTITVKFGADLQISQILSNGPALTDNYYDIKFKLKEVFD
tara:strand:+ start:2091 stop:3689 length:1599 start_codon:yes stop_codon:yes gene_type:complete